MEEVEIGQVSHWFGRLSVAAITLSAGLKVGDGIRIKGHTTDVELVVESMQIEGQEVQQAGPGDAVGLKVPGHARVSDRVYLVKSA